MLRLANLSTFRSWRKIVNASKATSKNFLENSLCGNENDRSLSSIETERSMSFDLQRRTDARRPTYKQPNYVSRTFRVRFFSLDEGKFKYPAAELSLRRKGNGEG